MQSLEEFARDHQPAYVPQTSPVTAALLTLAVYAAVGFMANHHSTWTTYRATPSRTVADMPPQDLPTPSDVSRETRQTAPQTAPHQQSASRQPSFLERLFGRSEPSPGTHGTGAQASAQSAPGRQQPAAARAGNSVTPSACQDTAWARAVANRVRQSFFYPQAARQKHVTGIATARLVVRRSGWLNELEITGTSGNAVLDDAAYVIARKAQPLPRIPDSIASDRIDVQLPVAFGMAGDFKPVIGNCGP